MCNNVNPPAGDTEQSQTFSASGFCRRCNCIHGLPSGAAHAHCLELIHHLRQYETLDLQPGVESASQLSTAYLFGAARGKMFGILECRDKNGNTVILRAFSGQYNGLWLVPGWAPPLFDPDEFSAVNDNEEKEIKALGRQLETFPPHSHGWLEMRQKRRRMSQELMQKLHAIYRLANFRGQTSTLFAAYINDGGIPTGTGDCCAPKLLHQAATMNLTPISIAEFYWGKVNRSQSRHHGSFYPSCREKCWPILGHLLCGATATEML